MYVFGPRIHKVQTLAEGKQLHQCHPNHRHRLSSSHSPLLIVIIPQFLLCYSYSKYLSLYLKAKSKRSVMTQTHQLPRHAEYTLYLISYFVYHYDVENTSQTVLIPKLCVNFFKTEYSTRQYSNREPAAQVNDVGQRGTVFKVYLHGNNLYLILSSPSLCSNEICKII